MTLLVAFLLFLHPSKTENHELARAQPVSYVRVVQGWGPEFLPQNPQKGGKKELTPQKLSSDLHIHTGVGTHTHNKCKTGNHRLKQMEVLRHPLVQHERKAGLALGEV